MVIRENQLLRSKGGKKENEDDFERSFAINGGVDQSAFTYKASLGDITKNEIENQND